LVEFISSGASLAMLIVLVALVKVSPPLPAKEEPSLNYKKPSEPPGALPVPVLSVSQTGALTFIDTTKTLSIPSDAPFDINSSTLTIEDNNITFDSTSGTTFTTTGAGAFTLAPATGQNLNVNLGGAGNFTVETNRFVVVNNGNVGIRDSTPDGLLDINGSFMLNGSLFSVGALGQGSLLVAKSTGNISELTKGANHYVLKVNGNALVWETDNTGTGSAPGGSAGQFQFSNGSTFMGNGVLSFAKATKTLTVPIDAPLDINSTSVSIADTDITFDGASTTFTSSGAFTLAPANNQNLNVNLGGTGKFSVETNQLYVANNGNVGISNASPNSKLTVNGALALLEGTAPGLTSGFGKFYVNSTNSKPYFIDDSGTSYNLANGSTITAASDYLRSNANTAYSSGTITFDSGTTVDINSTNVSIADDNIVFDSASGVTFSPATSQNLTVDLGGSGKFIVDSNRLVVNTNGNVGIKDSTPDGLLDVNGSFMLNGSLFSVGALGQGSLLVAKSAGNISELTRGSNHYVLKVNGNALVWETDNTGTGSAPGGSDGFLQFKDGSSFAGNGGLTFTKATKTINIANDAPLDINSTS
ncbi:hypothetical protein E3A20_22000, partial [Planctomyces bekefii]